MEKSFEKKLKYVIDKYKGLFMVRFTIISHINLVPTAHNDKYLPFSVGWFIILVFITSAGVPKMAIDSPEQVLKCWLYFSSTLQNLL